MRESARAGADHAAGGLRAGVTFIAESSPVACEFYLTAVYSRIQLARPDALR